MRPLPVALLLAAAVGSAGGAIVAVAAPDATRTAPARAAAGPPVTPPPATVRRVGSPRRADRTNVQLRLRGAARIAARRTDPRGGPDWALRTFLADRLAASGSRTRPGLHVIGRSRCVQLGRVFAGRFGWLDATGAFRAATPSFAGAPIDCLSRRPDLGGQPYAEVVMTTSDPEQPAAVPVQTVVWGLAGSAARSPELRVAGRPTTVRLGRDGALLAVLPPTVHARDVALSVAYPGRPQPVAVLGPGRRAAIDGLPARIRRSIQAPDPRAPVVLSAQAPDPDGGLPYGVATQRASDGGACADVGGRVVGDRIGRVDFTFDLLREADRVGDCPPTRAARERWRLPGGRTAPAYQMQEVYGGGLGVELGEDPARGRIARRTPRGRVILAGTADPDVASLTFESPSDVRTIVPTGAAHAFIVVYAGGFPTGRLVVTTRFRDGRVRRDEQPLGML